MTGRRLALVVVGVVAVAGCGAAPFGGGTGDTPVETLTPVPLPETETPSSTPTARPPGVTGDVVVPSRLRAAHESFLDGRSFEWTLRYNRSGESPLERNRYTRRAVVVDDRFLVEQRYETKPVTESLYVDRDTGYLRVVAGNDTRTEPLSQPGDVGDYVPTGRLIERFLTGLNLDVTTVERDGRTYHRIHSTSGRPSALERAGSPTTVTDYEVTAYVTPEGFVSSMVVRYDRTRNGNRQHVFFRFDYSDVGGVTLAEPDWVGRVASPTSTVRPNRTTSQNDAPTDSRGSTGEMTETGTDSPTETSTRVGAHDGSQRFSGE